MRTTAVFTLGLAVGLVASSAPDARAEVATQEEMKLISQNWLSYMVHHKGGWGREAAPRIIDVQEIVSGDTLLARCFFTAPRGYVVVPILKELPPIKAYSEEYGLDVSQTVGLPQLLREVLEHRINLFIERYGSLDACQPSTGDVLFDRVNRREWDRFLLEPEQFKRSLAARETLDEGGPLLTSLWHQSWPYNNSCPSGDGGPTVVGCTATAAAQVLNYHQWPPNGVGDRTYYWGGDGSCGGSTAGEFLYADFSNAYDWDNMPDDCLTGCSQAQEDALAELCYEVGVAYDMDYGACGSGAYTHIGLTVLPRHFRYDPAIDTERRADHTVDTWFSLIREEIDAGRPMLYGIARHAIVCDGWRDTGGEKQYHMNYGWGGPATVWYAVDGLYCEWPGCDPMVEDLIRNIKPWQPSDPDCNDNGIDDYQDIWAGTSQDCNGNAYPDECDIAGATSEDCQPDGVPDECQITDIVVPPDDSACSQTANNGEPWCDGFEGYPLGSIQGTNGWQGWGAGSGNPAWAGIVTTEQNHTPEGSQCLKIVDHDTVHLFEGYDTSASLYWSLSAWIFIPSSMTGTAYYIVLPDYDGGGSGTSWAINIIMDPLAGTIHSIEAFNSLTLITDEWVEIRLGINLEHDLVKIFYNDDLLGAHTWTATGGSASITAVDLWSPYSSGFYYDDLSLFPSLGVDCNNNDVPDECDMADCSPDNPSCQDCNWNGILDECDIAGDTSEDVNGNGVPDECDPPCADDAECDDGQYCTGVEECIENLCHPGNDPCPGQMCDEAGQKCVDCLEDAHCDDGLYCNGAEVCDDAGACQQGAEPCPAGFICDEENDKCLCEGDDACDDGIACTVDSCDPDTGQCQFTPDNSLCDDGNPCTDDACHAVNGCQSTPNDANSCDDGAFCNGAEACSGGSCVVTGAIPCQGGGFCSERDGACLECLDGSHCDDGDDCTVDTCPGGTCAHALLPACQDDDEDGVLNRDDECPGFDDTVDADGDGVADGCDDCPDDADNDTDDDGVCGNVDNCPADANSDQEDADGDGTGDVCDECPNDADDDADDDGLCGDVDNCPDEANPDQEDTDGDGVGDACDDCPDDADNDTDGDGVCGDVDNCPANANPNQGDADDDGVGDICDACPNDADNDTDDDGVCGDVDQCPDTPVGEAVSADGCADSQLDDDGDGVFNDVDECPDTPAGEEVDDEGCADSQLTDEDAGAPVPSGAGCGIFGIIPLALTFMGLAAMRGWSRRWGRARV